MLNIENEIHHVYMKNKKDQIAERRKQITDHQKMSSFWLSFSARLLYRMHSNFKLALGRMLHEPGGINITDVERLFLKNDLMNFQPVMICAESDQLSLMDHINSKRPSLKLKFKAIKEAIYNPAHYYLRYVSVDKDPVSHDRV